MVVRRVSAEKYNGHCRETLQWLCGCVLCVFTICFFFVNNFNAILIAQHIR